jgi:hypothetical protein
VSVTVFRAGITPAGQAAVLRSPAPVVIRFFREASVMDEDYALWAEMNPCRECEGSGEIADGDGEIVPCRQCDGSGIDPSAVYDPCPCLPG